MSPPSLRFLQEEKGVSRMSVSVVGPVTPAIQRTRGMLFRPFEFEKWLTLGFCTGWQISVPAAEVLAGKRPDSVEAARGPAAEEVEMVAELTISTT